MQQLLGDALIPHWFFALGSQQKTSLSIQYCRQYNFVYFNNPNIQQLKKCNKNIIVEGTYKLFEQLQKIKPELHVIFFGTNYSVEHQKKIRKQYLTIGYCKDVPKLDYISCRKSLNPNLILVYGPIHQQNHAVASTLAYNLSYLYSELPKDPNNLIAFSDKTKNYVINGLFTDPSQIKILDEYFNIKIIHLKYNRQDLPKFSKFFDEEHDLIPHLKDKKYYIQIKGNDDAVTIMDNVGIKLCPKLIYLNSDKSQKNRVFISKYLQQTDGILLSIFKIQAIRKRKNLPLIQDFRNKIIKIDKILYKDLNRQQIFLTDFPWQIQEFITLENINRKFNYFIDLVPPSKYQYSKQYSSPIYFLQNQTRISPSFDLSLKNQLNHHTEHWIVNGPGTCGKTSIAKYIAAQFGFKLIQFQTQAAAAKQKIASPEDGDQVPVRKYIAYFANIIKSNPNTIHIFDSIPYNNADLQQWVSQVGSPNVINLKAQPAQLIKRARKKVQSDVNAEVTQQQTTKVNQNIQKNNEWVQKLGQYCPSSKIYQVDYSIPQILAQPFINSILKPRIFLVQRNNHLVYQNIAIKYNMGFINLGKNPLRECASLVKKCGKRDVILCYYGQHDQRLISQDMYWIQKNLGDIRYLGIWEPQQTTTQQKMMKLERPPVPVKTKPAQGQQNQQQPPAQGDEQGKPKKVFDIYEHQWTQPVNHKNLSQWFFKLKKKVVKKTSNPKSCYNYFQQILDGLNNDKDSNYYQVIK